MPERRKTPTRLRALKVREISLVDSPANGGARVLLAKRDDSQDDDEPADDSLSMLDKIKKILFGKADPPLDEEDEDEIEKFDDDLEDDDEDEELSKLFGDLDEDDDVQQDDDSLTELNMKKAATLEEANVQLQKLHTALEKAGLKECTCGNMVQKGSTCSCGKVVKGEEEDLTKSLPEPIRKRLEAAEAESKTVRERLEKMEKENNDRIRLEKARKITKGTNAKAEDVAELLSKVDEAGAKVIEDMLAKQRAALDGLFIEKGTEDGEDSTEAATELSKAVAELRKADPKLTKEAAVAKALEQNPELYDEIEGQTVSA